MIKWKKPVSEFGFLIPGSIVGTKHLEVSKEGQHHHLLGRIREGFMGEVSQETDVELCGTEFQMKAEA